MGAHDDKPGGWLRFLSILFGLLVCIVMVAGCGGDTGTSANADPASDGGAQGGGQGGGQGGDDEPGFGWELPPSDGSPSGDEDGLYHDLLGCQGAEASIMEGWSGFTTPRNLLLFMAGAHLCHGDVAGGRPYYDRAISEYGLAGLVPDSFGCDVYQSVASVLEQAPRDSFTCPGGAEQSLWKTGPNGRDNPLTEDVDESQASEASTTSTPDEPSTGGTDDPTTSGSQEPPSSQGQDSGTP